MFHKYFLRGRLEYKCINTKWVLTLAVLDALRCLQMLDTSLADFGTKVALSKLKSWIYCVISSTE